MIKPAKKSILSTRFRNLFTRSGQFENNGRFYSEKKLSQVRQSDFQGRLRLEGNFWLSLADISGLSQKLFFSVMIIYSTCSKLFELRCLSLILDNCIGIILIFRSINKSTGIKSQQPNFAINILTFIFCRYRKINNRSVRWVNCEFRE